MKKLTLFLLTLIISCSVWAYDLSNNSKMYFAKPDDWTASDIVFMIGHSSYSRGYKMTNIKNTKLYYYNMPSWGGYTQWAVFNTTSEQTNKLTPGGNTTIDKQTSTKKTSITTTALGTRRLLKNGSSSNLSGYTALNHSQSIKVLISYNEGFFTSTADIATFTMNSYALNGDNSTKVTTGTNSVSAAYTAKVTLEVSSIEEGYEFIGWYNEKDECLSEETSYEYFADNATKTINAKFANKKTYVTINPETKNYVFFDPADWNVDKAWFAAYFFNSSTNKWVKLEKDDVLGYYYAEIPDGTWTNVIFTRMNNNYSELSWDADGKDYVWNQTGDIKLETNKVFKITAWDGQTTGWSSLSLSEKTISSSSNLLYTTLGKLKYELQMPSDKWYWVSLPFYVNISDITTSTGNGAKDLVITYYDAKERATTGKGWMNATEQNLTKLNANQGYVIGFYTDGNVKFPEDGVTVTFPSLSETNIVPTSIQMQTYDVTSTIDDIHSNWHIIGTGLYHQGSLSNINYVAMPAKNDKGEDTYEYKYISLGNELFTEKLGTNSFAPFTAFFVQHGGEYSATATDAQSAALAPVARAKAQQQEQIYLINMNEAHTVVILNAEGSEGYTAGEDFLEMNASNHSDLIYSFDGSDALAFNHRATETQSINLGGYVATAGEQTISLNAYNGNAEAVTLIDNLTGETADLLADSYTFTAEVGSLDGRFTVVFGAQKAGNTTVDCYNSTANQLIAYGSANACTVSGLTTGEAVVVYNAMGQLVFATIADSETITLPSLTTGNYLILHNGTTNKVLLK